MTNEINRINNFDLLRLIASISVIFSHCYAITHQKNLYFYGYQIGHIGFSAVAVFMVISGYLITQSWFSEPKPHMFLWKRILRIVPGLALISLFTIFIIGPLTTSLPLSTFYTSRETWSYLLITLVVFLQNDLPGMFANNPLPNTVNGSLWTIPVEFQMYIVLMVLGILGIIRNKKLYILIIALLSIFFFLNSQMPEALMFENISDLFTITGFLWLSKSSLLTMSVYYSLFFFMGSLYCLYREKIKYHFILFLVAITMPLILYQSGYFYHTLFLCLPYAVLYLARLNLGQFMNISRYGDYSYGIYIFGFVIQQTVAHFMPALGVFELFIICMPVIFVCAYLSWWLVEKPALSLKRIDPLAFPKTLAGEIRRRLSQQ